MTRAAQRREKHIKTPTFCLTQSQLDAKARESLEAHRKVMTEETIDTILCVVAYSLNTEFGYSTKRINRLFKDSIKRFEDITAGDISLNDLKQWCVDKNICFGGK